MSAYDYNDKKKVSPLAVAEVIIMVILALMIVAMIACNVMFRGNGAASVFGYSFYRTKAVSMVPEIPVNTVIIAKESEIPNIKERSVVLCNIGGNVTLTRVVDIEQENGQLYYIVKFDTSPANETFRLGSEDIIAKAIWQIESLGKVLDFATSVPGIIIAVIIPLAIIVIFQVIRIKNLRELEREADAFDDVEDIFERGKKEPEPVRAPEPKAAADPSDRLSDIEKNFGVRPVSQDRIQKKQELTVDDRGRADFTAPEKPAEPAPKQDAPLFTYDRTTGKASAGASAKNGTESGYSPVTTRIQSEKKEFAAAYAGKSEENVVFTPHLSNIIPDSLVNIQETAPTAAESEPAIGAKTYFEKEQPKPAPEEKPAEVTPTIPENAVVPKENIAPVKKKKSSKTLEELMSIIDAEETKLKK